MSEYQYYEFQRIGSTLSDKAMQEISQLSSRAQVTRSSASFTYHFGDFPGNPVKVLERHFDALLYLANWGTRQLAFSFPISAVECDAFLPFRLGEMIRIIRKETRLIVDVQIQDESLCTWSEGEGTLDRIACIYDDLLAGDFRALFLLWLQAASFKIEEGGDAALPPVPPGLQELSEAHHTLIDLFEVDKDVVTAAEPFSAPIRRVSDEGMALALEAVPDSEKAALLKRMVLGESPSVVVAGLRRRLRIDALSGQAPVNQPDSAIMAGVLFAKARQIQADRENAAKEQEAAQRLQRLAEIDRHQEGLWRRVDELIAGKTIKGYDEAIGILKDLRDLAVHQQKRKEFVLRVKAIRGRYPRLSGLQWRIEQAELLGSP